MSDQPGAENLSDDLTTYSVDDEDQLQPEDTLEPGGDPVEEGYTPPDRPHGSLAFGTTAAEQEQEETIEQRVRQEVPDPDSAYGAPRDEGGAGGAVLEGEAGAQREMLGGDDPDAIPAEQDVLGDHGEHTGQLTDPDGSASWDTEATEVAEDTGEPGLAGSPEEEAMHVDEDRSR